MTYIVFFMKENVVYVKFLYCDHTMIMATENTQRLEVWLDH